MDINNPIIVFGSGRCGTTVLSNILFCHKELGYPSNFNDKFPLYPYVSLMRRLIKSSFIPDYKTVYFQKKNNPFFRDIVFSPSEAWHMWEFITGIGEKFSRSYLLNERADYATIEFIKKYFSKILWAQGKDRLAFKYTGPSRIEYFLSIFKKPVFIYIKRNPVPTISSFLKSNFWQRQGINQLWWKGPFTDSELQLIEINKDNPIWMTSFQLKRIYDVTNHEINTFKPRLLEIKYEDFVFQPNKIMEKILEFCNLSNDISCFDYINKRKIIANNLPDSFYFNKNQLHIIDSIFN